MNRIGAVTAIGMATSSTHTSMNNCLNLGIMHGIYPLGMRNMGEAMLLGKLHLDMAYGNSNPDDAVVFSQFCNLIGDPTTSVHVGIPSTFSLEHQSTLPAGSSSLELVVKDSDQNPVSGAVTTLTNASGLQVLAQTDELGTVALNFPGTTTGELTIAVTKDDYIPSVSTTTISSAGNLVYSGLTVDDDNSGASSGNSNGLIDAGETMELFISLRNSSTSSLSGSATVSLVGNYATLQTTTANFGTVAAGAIAQNLAPIVLSLLPDAPDQHQVILRLSGTNAAGQWMVPLLLTINNGRLVYDSYVASGAVQNVINPGDQFNFTVGLGNEGSNALAGLTAELSSLDPMFEIIDPNGAYPQIQPGTVQQNIGDYFIVHARAQCQTGTVVPMELALTNSNGYAQTIHFTVTLGNSTVFDPLGQDAYGYFIYDEGDTSYQLVPEYDWLGIAPSEGGSGTQLALTDPGSSSDEGDQVGSVTIQTVNLPFSFSFYGRSYDRASISSNGFIAFGETANSDWRNWRLPGPGGNNPMLAVFWDDLEIGTGAGVYTYYDSDMNYFVVEWHNLLASNRTSEETFQAILYDPLFYPTSTGDGQIKLQYKVFNNTDTGHGAGIPHGNYSTIGIKDHTGLVGLEYTFNNTYPTAAAPLSHESSLFISTRPTLPDQAYLMYENTLIVDESITLNGLLEPGEIADMTISIGNMGMVPATGVYAVLESTDPMVEVLGDYSTFADVASLGSVSSDSYYGVTIDETCPNEHILGLRLRISSDSGSWIYPVRLKVHTPDLQIDGHSITEITGNMNGIIDPGETATMTVTLTNHGAVESPAGNAVIACHNVGISILEGSANFPAIPGYQSVDLNFTVSAASSMSQGSYVTFDITATAGEILLNHAIPMEIGAPIVVQIGTGATTQSYPLDRYYNFSVHESIYLASEIAHVGDIKALAFNKASGTDTNPIENVTIYMKHTTASTLSSGAYSLAGYTQVFSGAFPNTATSGWMEINLSPMFQYDGMSNLSILIVKEHQAWISYYPQWYYTSSSSRARQERNDNALPSTLASSNNLPNIRFKLFTTSTSILYPARNLSASSSHQSVSLSWDAPISGTPTQYKIFRNSSLLTSVTSLSYLDLAVNNGTSYSYYVVAMYGTESSDPTESVSATPNALPPTNLTADPGNMSVTLSWNAPSGREPQQMLLAPGREKTTDSFGLETDSDSNRQISSYRVYRNGSPIANVTETSYQDTGLINGQSYDYYVSTVYTNPAGESAASNVVSSTPIMVSFAVLGIGTSITTGSTMGPINLTYKSTHCQAVYTADELHALGVFGPIYINQLGFFVSSPPNLALTNFQIRIANTTATNATSWITQNLQTVFNPTTYMPTAGGFDMIQFHTPFLWDGTSNILIDTANGLVAEWSYSGTFQYTSRASGILRIYSDTVDQSYIFSGGTPASYRPNLRLGFQPIQTGPEIELSTDNLSFGNVELDTNSSLSFSISNPGDQELTGTIVSPAPFSVSLSESRAATQALKAPSQERNTISYNVPSGQSIVVSVSFSPSLPQAYNGQIVVNSNAADAQNISVAGTGIVTSLEQPVITIIESAGQICLNWESIQHADLYRIYRSDTPTSGFELIDSTSNTSWTDLTPPAKAFYRVEAYRNPPLSRQ
ncbi:MAG: C25 family cysteine peptidase [Candidatus Cloacimonadota bacterium]